MELKQVVQEFMLTPAPSGYESRMAYSLKEKLGLYTNHVTMDRAGNVISTFEGTDPQGPKLMVFAHMDQLGFIVRKIEKNGLIQVDRMGGIPEKVLPALRVLIFGIDGQLVRGVIGVKSHHMTPADEKYKVELVTNLFIDIGASNENQVIEAGIHIGCPVIYEPSYQEMMNDRVCGTAVDNRCGCAVLVETARQLSARQHAASVYLVGTVWEEFNIRGAVFAARAIKPDLAICIDVTMSGDTPELAAKFDIGKGRGPAVSMYNFHGRGTLNGCIGHQGLYRLALRCAEENKIPLQEFATLGMLTDAAYVQMEHQYIGCLDMGYPASYTHTPIESADLKDVQNLADLVTIMVCTLNRDFPVGRF